MSKADREEEMKVSQDPQSDQCADAGTHNPRSPIRRGDLIHYGEPPVALLSPKQPTKIGDYEKPRGLWVSVLGNDDWAAWCRAERFRDTRRQGATRVVLKPDARVLRLNSAIALDIFTRDYGAEVPWGRWTRRGIEWSRVAADWQGIIIAPYQWSRRLHGDTRWYYGWDCASGCIWDPAAVASLEPLRKGAARDMGSRAPQGVDAGPGSPTE